MYELPDGIVAAKRRAEDDLLARNGVTGVVVGLAEREGAASDDIVIRIYVRPGSDAAATLPVAIEGFPVETVEAEFVARSSAPAVTAEDDATVAGADGTHYDPLIGGISAGPDHMIDWEWTGGTLGAVVIDAQTYKPALLSNYHVFAVQPKWRVGAGIVQPGLIDSSFGSVVATLHRAELSEAIDAAVALQTDRDYAWEIAQLGPINGTAQATVGMSVAKRGRTTKLTHGTVSGLDASIWVNYEYGVGQKLFRDQIEIKTDASKSSVFSAGGDSGSVVVDDNVSVVGLLFAGTGDTTETERTYANHISQVTERLNVRIPGSDEVPSLGPKQLVPGLKSRNAPVLATAEGRPLVLAISDGGHQISISTSTDGTSFAAAVPLGQKASGEPAIVLAATGNAAQGDYIAWTGTDSKGTLNVAKLGTDWKIVPGTHKKLPEYSSANPGLAMTEDGTLVLAWKGRSNTSLNLATSTDGGQTFKKAPPLNQQSGLGPWIAQVERRLYLLWRGSTNARPNLAEITSLDPIAIGYPTVLNDETCGTHPSLAFAGQLLLGWQGQDSRTRINIGFARNGTDFKKVTFNERTVATPMICRFKETTLLAWTGTDSQINIAPLRVPA